MLGTQARGTVTEPFSGIMRLVQLRYCTSQVRWCVLQYGRPLGRLVVYGVGAFVRVRYDPDGQGLGAVQLVLLWPGAPGNTNRGGYRL